METPLSSLVIKGIGDLAGRKSWSNPVLVNRHSAFYSQYPKPILTLQGTDAI